MSQSENISLGYDSAGNPWLLKKDIPGSGGGWTALGYDDRDYPCARLLAEHPNLIVRWEVPEAYRAA